jgi:hypothetical protein
MSREDHDTLISDLLSHVKAPRVDHRIPLIEQHPARRLMAE